MKNKILSIIFSVALFFFILTSSIGLPVYFRPFYYLHIDMLELEDVSGFTEAEIRNAYDEVLDYLTLPNKAFGTGVMPFSKEGAAHFEDCKQLLDLNMTLLIISSAILIALLLLSKFRKSGGYYIGKRSAAFYSGVFAIALPLILGSLAAIDFDKAFELFHRAFFPGKDNWVFDWDSDQIIRVLPQEFFRNAAILIGAAVLIFSVSIIIIAEFKRSKKDQVG